MVPLTRIPSLFAAGALVALTAAGIPARSDDSAQNLGAVGPHEPLSCLDERYLAALAKLVYGASCISIPPRTSDGLAAQRTIALLKTNSPSTRASLLLR